MRCFDKGSIVELALNNKRKWWCFWRDFFEGGYFAKRRQKDLITRFLDQLTSFGCIGAQILGSQGLALYSQQTSFPFSAYTLYLRRKNLTLIIYFIIYGININDSHTIRCICSSICSIFCYWCVTRCCIMVYS